ncbi:hypothetical protein ACWKWU_19070 [Chitinophaga lutea]
MSLSALQLDPYLLAQMYDQPIIPEVRAAVPAAEKVLPKLKFLGENQKNIGLLIENEGEAYLNEELFNLLTNILNACKLGMQDVALLNVASFPGASLADLKDALPMRQCVIFAAAPASLGLPPLTPYQLETHAGIPVLYSGSLTDINADKSQKGRLWMGLKQLFGI